MGARPIPPEILAETLAAVKLYGSIAEAARRLGVNRLTMQHRYEVAKASEAAQLASHPEISRTTGQSSENPSAISQESVSNSLGCRIGRVTYKDEGPVIRVLAIGDHHDKVGRDKTRALWIGRHAAETCPDVIVSIGDYCSLDSLSVHETPGSANDAERAAFHQELESLDESLSMLHRDLGVGAIPTFQTMGNHEYRAVRAANRTPKLCGDLPIRLEEAFARYRIETRPFGEFLDIGGVDFVHVPLSIMGKEIGGEFAERTIGNKALKSTVFGHTHRANVLNVSKVGQQRKVTIVNLGTSLPYGTIEKYNGTAQTGWSWGIFELRIRAGEILSHKMFDMIELEEKYGD